MTNRPDENTYWVAPGRLLAGEYPGAQHPAEARAKLQRFLDAGVTCFIDLTKPDELNHYHPLLSELADGVTYHRLPIQDVDVPRHRGEMEAILDRVDGALEEGRTVYVHCYGGVGRTATVVGCWLVRHGHTGDEALEQIKQWWKTVAKAHRKPKSPETDAQEAYVRGWQEVHGRQAAKASDPNHGQHKYRGALLGLAAGDALGTTVEFKPPGTFAPLTDLVGGGPFGLKPGQWTDDTSMALCLAESLIACNGFDAADQMDRYVRWWKEGYLSSTGHCFDIGNTVRGALQRYCAEGAPFAGSTHPHSAGNGSLMRLAPVVLFYAVTPEEAIARAADSSRTTHGAPAAVDACRYFAGLLVGALQGRPKAELMAPFFTPVPGLWEAAPLQEDVAAVAAGAFRQKQPPEIRGTGYVVQSLEAALWAFDRTATFEEGALAAVNLGDDADTTGAIYGQLAGAYYGAAGIPKDWLARLTLRDRIAALADALYAHGHPKALPA